MINTTVTISLMTKFYLQFYLWLEILWLIEIDDFKADDQDTPEEKTEQNEKVVEVHNQEMLNVDRTEIDAGLCSTN